MGAKGHRRLKATGLKDTVAKALEIKAKGYKQCDHKLFEYQKYKYCKSLIRS